MSLHLYPVHPINCPNTFPDAAHTNVCRMLCRMLLTVAFLFPDAAHVEFDISAPKACPPPQHYTLRSSLIVLAHPCCHRCARAAPCRRRKSRSTLRPSSRSDRLSNELQAGFCSRSRPAVHIKQCLAAIVRLLTHCGGLVLRLEPDNRTRSEDSVLYVDMPFFRRSRAEEEEGI